MHRWHIQYLGCTELPSHLTDLEMESFFTLSHEERTLIQSRYKPNPRIAAAIQLGFLENGGTTLVRLQGVARKTIGLHRHSARRPGTHACVTARPV